MPYSGGKVSIVFRDYLSTIGYRQDIIVWVLYYLENENALSVSKFKRRLQKLN